MFQAVSKSGKLQDFFEQTAIINLPERTDRRREITQALDSVQMPLTPGKIDLFPAIRPAPETSQVFPCPGVLGCFLSHLAILKQAQAAGLANVLILEDDIAFTPVFVQTEAYLVERLSALDWSLVFLGFGPLPGYSFGDYYGPGLDTLSEAQPLLLEACTLPPKGSHFYGVNGKALGPLIDFLEGILAERLQREFVYEEGGLSLDAAYIDTALYLFGRQNPEAHCLIAYPNLAVQRSSRSDITPGTLDRLPLPPPLIAAIRSVKRLLSVR